MQKPYGTGHHYLTCDKQQMDELQPEHCFNEMPVQHLEQQMKNSSKVKDNYAFIWF